MCNNVKTCVVFMFFIGIIAQDIGQQCYLRDGSSSTCEHISKCISAQHELRQHLRPIICGYDGTLPIVCCDKNNNIKEERISELKCREYLELDIKTTISTSTPKTGLCFAVGGVDADSEEFPHMAILGYGSKKNIEFKCGGSLVSEQFVLTAAHCLESKELVVSLVRLGDLDIASEFDWAEPQDFNVTETYTHPDYDFQSFYHDIALIKLSRPVTYTRFVKPACLQSTFDMQHNNLTATGWGALEFGGNFHSKLQKVKLNSLPMQHCLRTYGPQARLPEGIDEELQICGGNLQKRMDTCQGDSGGPLQFQVQEYPLTHRIVGVTSFGNNCGLVPGVYIRISRYISWIESIVWPN